MKPNWSTIPENDNLMEDKVITNGKDNSKNLSFNLSKKKKIGIIIFIFVILIICTSLLSFDKSYFAELQLERILNENNKNINDENFEVQLEANKKETGNTQPIEKTVNEFDNNTENTGTTQISENNQETNNEEKLIGDLFGEGNINNSNKNNLNTNIKDDTVNEFDNTNQVIEKAFRENIHTVDLSKINYSEEENSDTNDSQNEENVEENQDDNQDNETTPENLHGSSNENGQVISGILHKNKGRSKYYIDTEDRKIYLNTNRDLDSVIGKEINVYYTGSLDNFIIDKITVPSLKNLVRSGPQNIYIILVISIISSALILIFRKKYKKFILKH